MFNFRMRLAALILLAVALALPANPSLAEITGRPRIIDGDTIEIQRQRYALRAQNHGWEPATPLLDRLPRGVPPRRPPLG